MTPNLEMLVRRAAEVENTPELQKYWERRYRESLEKNRFQINDKTLELVESNKAIAKPATPYADLILSSHQDEQGSLQENLLQETIEIAVRLLDALLDVIKFAPEAGAVVSEYRKIAIGLGGLDEFTKKQNKSEAEIVNYLGSSVSGKAYRASESLAEEKGSCLSWSKINQHLRPKSFEFWYNRDNGEIKNGQDLSQDFDQNSIKDSNFEIIPRRNSSLLLYPQTQEWATWSDRDETAPKTPIDTQTEPKKKEEVPPLVHSSEPKESEPLFQLGELVQIQKPGHAWHQAILQVVDLQESEVGVMYKLSDGQKETEDEMWSESNLSVVELGELLEMINKSKQSSGEAKKTWVENWARALIIDADKNQILVEQVGENVDLPGVIVQKNQLPEKILQRYLVENYQLAGNVQEEVGSAISLSENSGSSSYLHLGFLVDSKSLGYNTDTAWRPVNSDDLPQYARVLLGKLSQRQDKIKDLEQRLSLAIQEQRQIEEILQSEPDKQKAAAKYTSETSHREYKPEVLTKNLGSLSKYVLKLEQMVQSKTYGEMLLTLTYDGYGPRIVNLEGKDLPFELKQTLELFLELINFILTNNINPHFLAEKLKFSDREAVQLPIKQLLQFVGSSLQLAPERVQEIDSALIEEIDAKNLNKIKMRDTLKSNLENSK